jgi:hypothetical protein
MSLTSVGTSIVAILGIVPSAIGMDSLLSEPVRIVIWGALLIGLSHGIRIGFSQSASQHPKSTPVKPVHHSELSDSLPKTA